jgi:FkbM family methyltransferase
MKKSPLDRFFRTGYRVKRTIQELKFIKNLNLDNKALLEEILQKDSSIVNNYHNNISTNDIWFPKESFETFWFKQFLEQFHTFDKQEAYKQLVANLDETSQKTVSSILARMQRSFYSHDELIDIFTPEEKAHILKVRKDFQESVCQLDENCYAYGKYLLPINHFEPSVFYYKHEIDTLKTLENIKGKSIIDAGGFIGDSALVFADYSDKNIYTFEPTKDSFANMQKTIELNNSKNIIPQNLGLGSKEESIELFLNGSASSVNHNCLNTDQKETINITTVDKFVEKNNIEVGLIKVDIEGYEPELIKGAIETIKRDKPALILSIYHNAHDFFFLKKMIEDLNLGYKFRVHKPVDGQVLLETILIAEVY